MNTKTKKEHYVNNKEFLEAMIKYRKSVRKAKREKRTKPPVGDYLGSCFLKIANHLSYRPNFINYTFKDDMISDGIENCLQYLDNFDGKKSNNPFAYFTQIIYYAFIRRIMKEKKQQDIKFKFIEKMGIDDFIQAGMDGETANETMAYVDTLRQRIGEVRKKDTAIKDFAKKEKIKEKEKAKLELFYK